MCANICICSPGSAPPNQPQLGTVDAFLKKAVVYFTISSVAYVPENYTVIYGTSMDALTTVSNAFNQTDPTGLTFINDTNLMYTITVDGLDINQPYCYLIEATNSNGSTNSTIGNFTTAEACEHMLFCFFGSILSKVLTMVESKYSLRLNAWLLYA